MIRTALANQRSRVLAVIPAYNEQDSIAGVVSQIRNKGIVDNVLVIDDGSTDRTATVAAAAGAVVLKLPFNLGIGGAVQTGLKYAYERGYFYVIRLDGDGQHHANEVERLLQHVMEGKADIAVGSRFIPGIHTYRAPFSRMMGIRWFSIMISLITQTKAYDTTSGMQAMNRRAFSILAKNYPQDYPEVEARILLHKAGLNVIEVPVKMEPRSAGVSSINYPRAIYYMFKVTLATLMAAIRSAPMYASEEV